MFRVLLYQLDLNSNQLLDTKVVLRNNQLLASASIPLSRNLHEAVASIVKDETGLNVAWERFRIVGRRSDTELYAVSLTDSEVFSTEGVVTLGGMLSSCEVDWEVIGMVLEGISSHESHQSLINKT